MKKYRITYWMEQFDEQHDYDEIVEALTAESALKIFLHNNQHRPIKRGKDSITIKQIN